MKARPAYKSSMLWKTLVSALALLLLTTAPLAAQDYEEQQQQQQQQGQGYESQSAEQETKAPNKENLEKFAKARPKIKEIRSEYADKLQEVKDDAKAKELQEKYSQQMVDVIENVGLTVQKYNEIAMAVQNDPDLQDKVSKMSQ